MPKSKNETKTNERLDGVEKKLVEDFRRRQTTPPNTGTGWMQQVMAAVTKIEPGKKQTGWFAVNELQGSLLWRFSSAVAALSLVLVVLFLALGGQLNLEVLANLLLDPLGSLSLEWMLG